MTEKNQKLVDTLAEHVVLNLVEGKEDDAGNNDGKVYVRGEFGSALKPTANGRLYPPKLWEGQIDRLKNDLGSRKVLGELDHPTDGRTALQRASHVITDLKLVNGVVIGEAEILDTSMGRDLKAILKAGVPVGISSRGYGSTKPDDKGNEVVQAEDYKLVTFDFVAEPADNTAYPQAFFEGVEVPMDTDKEKELSAKFAEKVVAARKEGEDAVEATLRKEFESDLLAHVSQMRDAVEKDVREQLLADPKVAGAKSALETILNAVRPYLLSDETAKVVESRDQEIEDLKTKVAELELKVTEKDEVIEKLGTAVKEAGYKFRLERLIDGDENADEIREAVGNVVEYESADALSEAVTDVRSKISARREQAREREERIHAVENALKNKNSELAEGLEEALLSNKQLALQLYAERRLANHPEADKIRAVLEHTTLSSREQVDDLLERFREVEKDPDDLSAVRDRVRSKLGGGREHVTEARTRRSGRPEKDYNGLGTSLSELRSLSGLRDRG